MSQNELDNLRNECALKMVKVMSDFQMFERELKELISRKYDAIRLLVNGRAVFKFSKANLNNKMLGGLVAELSNLTDDEKLIKELKELVPCRNEIAHERFVKLSESDDVEYLKSTLEWLQGIETKITQITIRYVNSIFSTASVCIDAMKSNK